LLRKLLAVTLLCLAALALAPSPARAATVTVDMHDDNTFTPPEATVNAGDTVVFRNAGAVPHTATLKGLFDSGLVNAGATYEVVTDANYPPTFEYICTLHVTLGMKAKMTVAGGTGTLPTEEEPPVTSSPTPQLPENLAARWWARTQLLPVGLRVFAPLALALFFVLTALGGLGYLKALKKAKQA
jgi:plastocyanin